MLLVADGITGGGVLEAYCCSDIAGEYLIQLVSLVRMHLKQTADTLLLALGSVQYIGTGLADAGVNTEVSKLSYERVCHNLEYQSGERLLIRGMSHNRVAVQVGTLDIRYIGRSRHIVKNCVQKLLNTLVSVCGTAEARNRSVLDGSLAECSLHLLFGGLLAVKVLHHQVIIKLTDLLDHLGSVELCIILQVVRNVGNLDIVALVVLIVVCLHLEEVDDALEGLLTADRDLHHDGVLAQTVMNGIYRMEEVGTDNVHLIDKCDSRNVVGISLTPYVLRLGLNTALCVKYADSAVQNTEGSLNLYGKVNVSGSIDDVDSVLQSTRNLLVELLVCPVAGGSSRGDGDTSLLLLLHPVHGRRTLMGIADLVVNTGIIQDTLGQSRLTRIDMGHDSDVSGSL